MVGTLNLMGNVYRIVPNDFDDPAAIKGKCIPSSEAKRPYQIVVEWADEYQALESSDASEVSCSCDKKDFPCGREPAEAFYRRLDDRPRELENSKLTYFIMRSDW